MTLAGVEFARRFLLHTLPKGFVSIRHFGFLANRVRSKNLPLARRLLQQDRPSSRTETQSSMPEPAVDPADTLDRCPRCKTGRLLVIQELPAGHPALDDTS